MNIFNLAPLVEYALKGGTTQSIQTWNDSFALWEAYQQVNGKLNIADLQKSGNLIPALNAISRITLLCGQMLSDKANEAAAITALSEIQALVMK